MQNGILSKAEIAKAESQKKDFAKYEKHMGAPDREMHKNAA
jgi:hypothetical protein